MQGVNHIFLIDDDKSLNKIHTKIFRLAGYENKITAFANAVEALSELEQMKETGNADMPQLIFLDILMPGSDGWAFLSAFEKLFTPTTRKSKIYMLATVVVQPEIARAESHWSVDGMIQKPLSVYKLKKLFEVIHGDIFFVAQQ